MIHLTQPTAPAIDAAIRAAQERIHRSVGQRARAAKRAIAFSVWSHRQLIDLHHGLTPLHASLISMMGRT